MPDLAEFFDRFDAMKPTRSIDEALTNEGLASAARSVLPLYLQLAERTGVDLDVLWDEQVERLRLLPDIVVARGLTSSNAHSVQEELLGCLANVGVECFMAGVLWEQQRQLPDLDGGA